MLAIRCLKLAGLYLVLGMSMGVFMGASKSFALAPVHAHVNLLGWVTLALAAGVFKLWPQAAQTRLASVFFWIYNLSLPVTLVALTFLLSGFQAAAPVLGFTEIGVWIGGVLFVVNLFRALPGTRRGSAVGMRATVTITAGSPQELMRSGTFSASPG